MTERESRIVSICNDEVIDREAADWLTKLDRGELSKGDRAALKQWLNQSPEHADSLRAMAAMWSDMNYLLNALPEIEKEPMVSSPRVFMQAKSFVFALPVLLICILGLVIWQLPVPSAKEQAFYTTQLGQRSEELFVDGSKAHLNTNSIIETEFTADKRIVRLMRGEALFDVAHDPDRPFTVYAGDQMVVAIGTKFVVRLDSESILVTVTDGQVQLTSRPKSNGQAAAAREVQEVIFLSKGEQVEVNNTLEQESFDTKPEVIESDELTSQLAWLKGQLVFEDKRLEEVIEEVSRYVPNQIIIEDPELRDIRISGRFQVGDTEALLEAIEVYFNVQSQHLESGAIHLFAMDQSKN